ncbi:glycosyl transferase [Deminuibacter soli]|uniref:Glycosyl transferase n=1 Tax=Deminuibacter soli TaxID=2291815 RepID=A0A3E1NF46_9BACT|nr:glycosyl transferase [Deminuibacter soli]RFM26492.1 glycosyl transferase [Deminuibacter soli]
MKKIAFTICSNNYLAQASLLVQSFMDLNADYEFYIGLVDDVLPSIRYPAREGLQIISCREVVPAALLQQMAARYKIVELNTSVKPFYVEYFFNKYDNCQVIYLDPDIYVYNSFKEIDDLLQQHDMVITPHCLTPIPLDGHHPQERAFTKYGVYNLGFIALRKSPDSSAYIQWLKERLAALCYAEAELGVYTDQLWVNLLPVFFNNVYVSRHPGMNAAFWNLHERQFSEQNGRYKVNDACDLLFFHFSSFRINSWQSLASYQTRYTVETRPDVKTLFEQYAKAYQHAKTVYSSQVPCVFTQRSLLGKWQYYYNRYRIRKDLAV